MAFIGAMATLLMTLAGCSYGPARISVELENALAQPNSHTFAVAVSYGRVQDPTGLAAFPDGGSLKILERKARVYIVDTDSASIKLAADIEQVEGISRPTSVWIRGWQNGAAYFSISGYNGHSASGDDIRNMLRAYYRINPDSSVERIPSLPSNLGSTTQTGLARTPPFLLLSKGHNAIDIGIDERPNRSRPMARFWLDEKSGEPHFQINANGKP